MKKDYLLKGYIKSKNKTVGPFTIDFCFDEKVPGYEQKTGNLYLTNDEHSRSKFSEFSKLYSSNEPLTFISKGYSSTIELRGFSLQTLIGTSGPSELWDIKKIAEFKFETFVEKYGNLEKINSPIKVYLHIEDMVFFRPFLDINYSSLEKVESDKISVCFNDDKKFLYFETENLIFETICEMSPSGKKRDEISISTPPFLVVSSKSKQLKDQDLINAGENLILLFSFLEERFIRHISETIYYNTSENTKPIWEFRHTHYAKPMSEPWRSDLKAQMPMDKFTSSDIKTMYLAFERINNDPTVENLSQIFYLYLNAIKANMIYYRIGDSYACIDKLLKIAPKILKGFEYSRGKKQSKHKNKIKQLCEFLEIGLSDLLDKKGELGYIQIRDDYIHQLLYKHKHEFDEIADAMDKARYLCRRIIFKFLGLEYRNYNSCDPQKYGKIGL